jgi:hypothetical protein
MNSTILYRAYRRAQIGEKEQYIKNIRKAFKSINDACPREQTGKKSSKLFRTQELVGNMGYT